MTDIPDTTQAPVAAAGAAGAQPTESWATNALVVVLAAALIVTGGGLGGMLVYKFTSKDRNFAAVDTEFASHEADIDDKSASHEADIDDKSVAVDINDRFPSHEADKIAALEAKIAALDTEIDELDDRIDELDLKLVGLVAALNAREAR